jgi:hypothetical protein
MQNKIDATLTVEKRDQILDLFRQIFALLPFLVDLTPEERHSLFKMGDWGRPIVEGTLVLAEQDDSFLPRSFDVAEMRQDKDLFDNLSPVFVQLSRLFEAVQDTLMLTGSDLILAAFDIYGNAKENGKGEHLDNLVPLVARRFKRKGKKDGEGEGEGSDNNPQG